LSKFEAVLAEEFPMDFFLVLPLVYENPDMRAFASHFNSFSNEYNCSSAFKYVYVSFLLSYGNIYNSVIYGNNLLLVVNVVEKWWFDNPKFKSLYIVIS
jgi:hypothetical protein